MIDLVLLRLRAFKLVKRRPEKDRICERQIHPQYHLELCS